MIKTFGDKETELVYNQFRVKKIPVDIQYRSLVKLMLIDAAETESDLKVPPGNRLEKLKGRFENYWSVRINAQWRIIFRFSAGNAYDVKIVDYH